MLSLMQDITLADNVQVPLISLIGGIGLVPCVGWIAPFLVAAMGLGGVILTRFGSQPYLMLEPETPRKISKSSE